MDEAAFAKETGDLIAITDRDRLPLRRLLESFTKLRFSRLFRAKHVENVHVRSKATKYSNNDKIESLTNAAIILVGLLMLLAPM